MTPAEEAEFIALWTAGPVDDTCDRGGNGVFTVWGTALWTSGRIRTEIYGFDLKPRFFNKIQ
jgi:hypothetical protein